MLLAIDDLSRFFLVLIALLWLLVTFYTFEYIKHEGKDVRFFSFFLMTLGVIMGLCMAGNFFTVYLFYELMTLITYPLVVHSETPEAMKAGNKYLAYSFFGASFALIGFVFAGHFGYTTNFMPGGVLDPALVAGHENLLLAVFMLTFIGFGCKAGMWPLHAWLPTAHPVAPAPASALLSGVITKAGVLAIIRSTFFVFGVDFVYGTWVQTTLMVMTLFTVFMGSMLAYKEKLLKRRLAYSTVSQVSYVLFGFTILSYIGFEGAMLHIIFHAVIKNILFLAAGAIIYMTHKTYVYELRGIGKSMPVTLWCFTIASVALVGIPPTAGVVSKWSLAMGGMMSTQPLLGMVGAGILLISALLTAGYLISIVAVSFFPGSNFDYKNLKKAEPNKLMTVPLVILSVCCFVFGMFPTPLMDFIDRIASTLF
ncbi:MAG: proton-conducting membrane transporter [Defluviitaleaceae bacterium]|nr:proton-conducting membrane transporter [Defluviitaleaceae bacterium]